MSSISFSNISDGTTIDAADVNNPLNTIYDDYNGGIDSNNLADNAVTTAKITDSSITNAKLSTTAGELGGLPLSTTPTPTSSTGTLTTATSKIEYAQIGVWVLANVTVTITTNGTGAGSIQVTLPITAKSGEVYMGSGRADGVSGKLLQAKVSTTTITFFNYDNTYPASSGEKLRATVWYQKA